MMQRPIQPTKSGVVHRKKCRHPKTPTDLLHRFCLVCSCKAENYNFGVISCESCKAFFRRNAHKKYLEGGSGFACSYRRGGCDVNAVTRKKCPGCRLAKCFAVGMQADLIQRVDQAGGDEQQLLVLQLHPPQLAASYAVKIRQHQQEQRDDQFQYQQQAASPEHSEHLVRLWQQLQTPVASCPPSSFTEASCHARAVASDHAYANILLVDFFVELRRLVKATMLGDIATDSDIGGGSISGVALLEAFVHQAAKFVAGLRQIDRLERPHFVALLRRRLHSVLFPLSCAGFSHLDGGFYFTIAGRRVMCQPIELFCDLVRQTSSSLVDYTPLAEYQAYTRGLLDLTEMRPELLALFCAAKLLHLPADCEFPEFSEDEEARLRGAFANLADRYHQHLLDSLYYHYPFDFEVKLQACCQLFKWSGDFDSCLEKFIQYCPLTTAMSGE